MTTIEKAVPFPKDAAGTVRHWANFFFFQPALDALDLVEDLMGHPEKVQQAVDSWERAASAMNASLKTAQTASSEIVTSWTGPAALGFGIYITDVKTKIPVNVTALQTATQATATLYSTIIATYKTCINFIIDCAKDLSTFVADGLSDWKSWVAGLSAPSTGGTSVFVFASKHVTALLSSFVDNVKKAIDDSLDQHAEQVKALNGVSGAVTSIDAPGAPSERIKDSDSWKPL